jgi:hypothetical protein
MATAIGYTYSFEVFARIIGFLGVFYSLKGFLRYVLKQGMGYRGMGRLEQQSEH